MLYVATLFNRGLLFDFGLTPLTVWDKPWTILTSMFVHAGLWHVAANMWTLYFFGTYLSQLIGERDFLLVYFLGGILGGIFYALWANPLTTAVGASGAIFALGGALAVMRPKLSVYIFPIPAPVPLWIAITGGFVLLSFFPGVAWLGHFGGLVLGLVMGYFFRKRERSRLL
ncbi:MAG: rhomboid family intramembrane serine protease [Dehalococcoidia bacterium]|nr:rhomboid family intramembrane serine protease [Dehalococcoidia bacterium]